jgi:hypothetical protein
MEVLQVITGEIQRNVTKLSAMGVQGAVEMNAIFGQAAGSAGDMTDSIGLICRKKSRCIYLRSFKRNGWFYDTDGW